jgi:hypothetical protein
VIGFVGSAAALWLWGKGGRDALQRQFSGAELALLITAPFFIFMAIRCRSPARPTTSTDVPRLSGLRRVSRSHHRPDGSHRRLERTSRWHGNRRDDRAAELLRHGYDKRKVTGAIQAGSSWHSIPPSVVLFLR